MGTEQDFAAALDDALGVAFKKHKLKFPALRAMIAEYRSVGAAQRLLETRLPSNGLTELTSRGSPELTVEYLAQEPQFRHLFSEPQLATASQRVPRS